MILDLFLELKSVPSDEVRARLAPKLRDGSNHCRWSKSLEVAALENYDLPEDSNWQKSFFTSYTWIKRLLIK